MGTQLYERGIPLTASYEELNLSRPDTIRSLHEDYLRAGARVLETNTFGANSTRLGRHGLEGDVRALNLAGVTRAREAMQAAGIDAFVAGAMGPTGLSAANWMESQQREIGDGFRAQAEALAEAGVDLLMIETMLQPIELTLAVEAAKRTGLPVVAHACFIKGVMADGTTPEAIATRLFDLGADVIGANCGEGPTELLAIAERMLAHHRVPISIAPNAGLPQRGPRDEGAIEDRLVYPATPEEFQRLARRLFDLGVRIVGGCCGSTPDHIREIAAAASTTARAD